MSRTNCHPIRSVLGSAAFGTLLTVASAASSAQDAGSGSPSRPALDALEEVVVTGQKREERVQEIPKQVVVVSQQQMDSAGVSRITDLQVVFPSLNAQPQNQSPRVPGIRGIAPIAFSVGVQGQTGIVVDDIPQSTYSTLAFSLADVERVELFPGPQSTLSGRNAAAGIINFVTRGPSATPQYEINVEQSDDRQTKATAFLTGPVTGKLNYSLSVMYDKWDGPLRNVVRGDRLEGFDTKGARGKLRLLATDDLTATISGFYIKTDRATAPVLSGLNYIVGSPAATFVFDAQNPQRPVSQLYPGIQIGPHNRDIYSPENGSATTKDRGVTLQIDYNLGSVGKLSSLTSYTHSNQPRTDAFIGNPQDNLVVPVQDFSAVTDVDTKFYTQEFRLASTGSGPFTYLVGAIFTKSDLMQPYVRAQLFPVDWDQGVTVRSTALYGRGSYDFTSTDSLTLGLRVQNEKLGYTWRFIPIAASDPNTLSSGSNNYTFPAGEISYTHKFTDNVRSYVTYSQSEAGKAYDLQNNGDAAIGTLQPLASERVHNVEIGLKSELFDRRVVFNASAFLAKYSNYQIQTATTGSLTSAPTIRLLSIGKVDSRGIEINTQARVTSQFNLGLNIALIDTKIKSFPNAACYTGQSAQQGCVNGSQGDLSGLSLPYSSKLALTSSADYRIPLSNFDIDLGAVFRFQSRQHYDVLGDPMTYQGGYGTLNLYAGPQSRDGKWRVQVYVNNMLNKTYYSSLAHSPFYVLADGSLPMVSATYGRDSFRYAGIRVSAKF